MPLQDGHSPKSFSAFSASPRLAAHQAAKPHRPFCKLHCLNINNAPSGNNDWVFSGGLMRFFRLSKVLLQMALMICFGLICFSAAYAQSQRRDHLSEQESDLVREAQEIDRRIAVFVKAADRRILVLTDPNATQKKKEEETWGPLPTGTKAELLTDYRRILEEAEEKLDDLFSRDPKNDLLKKALHKFKEAANKQIPQLRALAPQMTERKDQRALEEAIEEAETVTKADVSN